MLKIIFEFRKKIHYKKSKKYIKTKKKSIFKKSEKKKLAKNAKKEQSSTWNPKKLGHAWAEPVPGSKEIWQIKPEQQTQTKLFEGVNHIIFTRYGLSLRIFGFCLHL